ncbi:MAG: hypothetical protein ACJAS6_001314, partial [Rickettsiales bacterium]
MKTKSILESIRNKMKKIEKTDESKTPENVADEAHDDFEYIDDSKEVLSSNKKPIIDPVSDNKDAVKSAEGDFDFLSEEISEDKDTSEEEDLGLGLIDEHEKDVEENLSLGIEDDVPGIEDFKLENRKKDSQQDNLAVEKDSLVSQNEESLQDDLGGEFDIEDDEDLDLASEMESSELEEEMKNSQEQDLSENLDVENSVPESVSDESLEDEENVIFEEENFENMEEVIEDGDKKTLELPPENGGGSEEIFDENDLDLSVDLDDEILDSSEKVEDLSETGSNDDLDEEFLDNIEEDESEESSEFSAPEEVEDDVEDILIEDENEEEVLDLEEGGDEEEDLDLDLDLDLD